MSRLIEPSPSPRGKRERNGAPAAPTGDARRRRYGRAAAWPRIVVPVTAARVALVIPALNEAESIGAVLREVPPGTAQWIFVVAGESTDGTAAIAREHGALVPPAPRPGYGAACLAGVWAAALAGADVIAFLDGDYSDPPGDLPRVLAPLLDGSADLVLGCRCLARHPQAMPAHARLGNRLVLLAIRLLTGRSLCDLPSFKAIRADCLEGLDLRETTYGFTVELLVKAVRVGLRIAQAPVEYRPRLAGRSKVSGTLRGSAGAAWKLCWCAARYARWSPRGA